MLSLKFQNFTVQFSTSDKTGTLPLSAPYTPDLRDALLLPPVPMEYGFQCQKLLTGQV